MTGGQGSYHEGNKPRRIGSFDASEIAGILAHGFRVRLVAASQSGLLCQNSLGLVTTGEQYLTFPSTPKLPMVTQESNAISNL